MLKHIFIVISILSVGYNDFNCSENMKHTRPPNDFNFNIDSIKWIAYSINYHKNAFSISDTAVLLKSIIECDINISKTYSENKDTCFYTYYFYKGSEKNVLIPNDGYYDMIGVVPKNKYMFPVHSIIDLSFTRNVDSCNFFFQEKERKFREYLKSYNGEISIWLKQEASRRNILK